MTEDVFWENLSYSLLEMNLNNESLNKQILTGLFKDKPEALHQMDFGDGIGVDGLDQKLFSGSADVVQVREAKPHELWECIPCGKRFRRKDNRDRHLRSGLHARRLAKYMEAKQRKEEEETEKTVVLV